jgi:hypothetical protein
MSKSEIIKARFDAIEAQVRRVIVSPTQARAMLRMVAREMIQDGSPYGGITILRALEVLTGEAISAYSLAVEQPQDPNKVLPFRTPKLDEPKR